MDTLSPAERSARMALVRAKDTQPERVVRRLVNILGYRYRLHVRELKGCPDLVLRNQRKAIFVHGCFWHRHARCRLARLPKSRLKFWQTKLDGNRWRDLRTRRALVREGWRVLVIWECQTERDLDAVTGRLKEFLSA